MSDEKNDDDDDNNDDRTLQLDVCVGSHQALDIPSPNLIKTAIGRQRNPMNINN